MDSLTNKLAAFIVDKGKHSEFVFNNGGDLTGKVQRVSRPCPVFGDPDGDVYYAVPADALVFSAGLVLQGHKVELLLCINPYDTLALALDNADMDYMIPEGEPVMFDVGVTPEHFRHNYRALYGFDGVALEVGVFNRVQKDRPSSMPVLEIDINYTKLRDVVYGVNVEKQTSDARDVGVSFVAVRTIGEGKPNPVFWMNGNYLQGASEEESNLIADLFAVVDAHLFERYGRGLLQQARGFCPHLLS